MIPMGSKPRSRRRSCAWPLVSPANGEPNHFLKIILPEAIHGKKMRIPEEFIRRFENELSREATITVPDGLVWKMELKKSANEVWFCNGWREFVKYYSISFGSFLVFKYEGNSHFCVVIFDMSAAEIYYPCKNQSNNEELNFEKQHSESECSRKRSSLDHCGYKRRSKRANLENQEIIDVDDVNALSHGKLGKNNISYNSLEHSRKHGKDRSRQGPSSKMESTLRKKQRAIEAAQKFKPTNPSFTAIIRSSNMTRRYMDVPASFAKTYLGKLDSMRLQDSNGQQWAINYRKNNCSIIRMGKGWMGFARANNVREGDVCVFELIKRKNIVLKVTIFAWS